MFHGRKLGTVRLVVVGRRHELFHAVKLARHLVRHELPGLFHALHRRKVQAGQNGHEQIEIVDFQRARRQLDEPLKNKPLENAPKTQHTKAHLDLGSPFLWRCVRQALCGNPRRGLVEALCQCLHCAREQVRAERSLHTINLPVAAFSCSFEALRKSNGSTASKRRISMRVIWRATSSGTSDSS